MKKRETVILGMSGGMDSAVAAGFLTRAGYDVRGVTLKLWDETGQESEKWLERTCCKVGLAQHAADYYGIPLDVIDVRAAFRETVVENFKSEYASGRTPNPCVRCNAFIKFSRLFAAAERVGADFVATGHYARVAQNSDTASWALHAGIDATKDQSYFLYRLPYRDLSRLIFPLGGMQKSDVRSIATEIGIPMEEWGESQEVCFVTQESYPEFLEAEGVLQDRPGEIVSMSGECLGEHAGFSRYTIGQRRGLGVAHERPLYVVALEPEENRVIVGEEDALLRSTVTVLDTHWLLPAPPNGPIRVRAKIRYRHPGAEAIVEPEVGNRARVIFEVPQRAVAPGQSIVFYRDDTVIGGGIIEKSAHAD